MMDLFAISRFECTILACTDAVSAKQWNGVKCGVILNLSL